MAVLNQEATSLQSEHNLVELIDGVVREIRKTPELAKFYAESLKRLQSFREVLDNVETRIAIIGITSSGKSTLMNAVLGAELLPTRVGPSSSKQVICGWDEKQQGEILFEQETGKRPRVVDGDATTIRHELEKYGDEKFNPHNREQVDEIRVHAPGFRFNKDLVIIDTPGLDAYGLDQHKEVTMKLVLPTVDMILFLTNVKCDSDGANLEFIDNVTTDDKPLIIVQNKIDSIEAKNTRTGIAKTIEEVKHDHLVRMQRLISHAKKESVRRAPIVQVSAKASSWEKSNLGELGKVLDEQLRLNSRFRVARRASRLAGIFEEMLDALEPKIAHSQEAAASQRNQRQQFEKRTKCVRELSSYWKKVDEDFTRRLQHVESSKDALLAEIDSEYMKSSGGLSRFVAGFTGGSEKKSYKKVSSLSSAVERLKRSFESETREINSAFSSTITETQTRIAECCRKLNMDETQIARSKPFRSRNVSIAGCQETHRVEHTRKVKRQTLGGWFKRGLGALFGNDDWGYDEETYTTTETTFNIEKLVASINQAYRDFASSFSEQFPVYMKNTETAVERFEDEVESQRAGLEAQAKQEVPVESGRRVQNALQAKIEKLRQTADGGVAIANAVVTEKAVQSTVSEMACPALVACAARFAHVASFENAARLTDWQLRRSGCRTTYVCGWDGPKLGLFRDWFFRPDADVRVVDFSQTSFANVPSDALVYLLFNAEQTGSFKGKLFGSGKATETLKSVARNGKIVWVMDSVREHVSGGASRDVLSEAYCEMLKIVHEFLRGESVFGIMACEREIYWSVLLHELYFNKALYASETTRQRFVDEMSTLFRHTNERRHATGNYVAQFSNLRKEIEK